jgi:ribosomal-protein-alanine N-acetyltransferase
MYTYRQFKPEDVEAIKDIVSSSLGEYYPESLYLQQSRQWKEGFLVCLHEGHVVGLLMGTMQGKEEARVLLLAVEKPHRKKGIGTELMKRFISISKERGAKRVSLEVRVSNREAIQFYEHLGFTKNGVLLMYYSDMEDGIKMVRPI